MKTYKIKNGQNIFDVAIDLYGSIEGIYDLMISNQDLSMDTDLKADQELMYHEDFVINSDIPEYFISNNITPINGKRNVYIKQTDLPLKCVIDILSVEDHSVLELSGDGTITVDWGDNSQLEEIVLSSVVKQYLHFFDNTVEKRYIKLYGDFNIQTFIASEVIGNIMPIMPMVVDEFTSIKNSMALTGLFLFKGLYKLDLSKSYVESLTSIYDMSLQTLNLNNCKFKNECVNEYLIHIATHYGTRRNCQVIMSYIPSGNYKEPLKDNNGNYIINTGMEAIWVITHETSWNENGVWEFIINNITYKYEP